MPQPNILLIMTDQHRADALGFMGNSIVATPNLDALAASGVVFDNAFVQCPVCMASRAAIHTGRYPAATRVRSMGLLPPTEVTLAETLKRAGYRTGMFGKLHFTPQEYTIHELRTDRPIHDASVFLDAAGIGNSAMHAAASDPYKKNYGFDVADGVEDFQSGNYFEWLLSQAPEYLSHAKGINWGLTAERALYDREPHATQRFPELLNDFYESRLPAELHPSHYITEKTVEFLQNNSDQPFFAHCSFVDPHHPFNASPPYSTMYPPGDMPVPSAVDTERCYPDDLPEGIWSQILEQNQFPDEFWQAVLANYYGMISHVDQCIGRVLETLRSLGLEQNTIVVFISDHGEYVGDHRLLRKGSLLFESIIHVPLIFSWPGHLRSGRMNEMVQEIDLYPTLMSLTGLESHPGVQGKDLSGALISPSEGDTSAVTDDAVGYQRVFCELDHLANPIFAIPYFQPTQLVRTQRWKLIYYPGARTGLLYDLQDDPGETVNRYFDFSCRETRGAMMMDLLDHHYETKDPLPLRLSQA